MIPMLLHPINLHYQTSVDVTTLLIGGYLNYRAVYDDLLSPCRNSLDHWAPRLERKRDGNF